jgi:hypothetical protein
VKLPHIMPPLEPLLPLEPLEPLLPLLLPPPLVRHLMSALLSASQPLATDALPLLPHFHEVAVAAHACAASYSVVQPAGTFASCALQSDTHVDCPEHLAVAAAAQALSQAVVPVDPLVPPLVAPLVPPLLPGFGWLPFTVCAPPSPSSPERSIVRIVGDEHAVTRATPAKETPQANMTKRMTNLQGAISDRAVAREAAGEADDTQGCFEEPSPSARVDAA